MKKNQFIKKTCAYIASIPCNRAVVPLLVDLMATGMCRPATSDKRGITDHTWEVIHALEEIGMKQQGTCQNGVNIRKGYLKGNDAPRGGRNGDFIKVDFEWR